MASIQRKCNAEDDSNMIDVERDGARQMMPIITLKVGGCFHLADMEQEAGKRNQSVSIDSRCGLHCHAPMKTRSDRDTA